MRLKKTVMVPEYSTWVKCDGCGREVEALGNTVPLDMNNVFANLPRKARTTIRGSEPYEVGLDICPQCYDKLMDSFLEKK